MKKVVLVFCLLWAALVISDPIIQLTGKESSDLAQANGMKAELSELKEKLNVIPETNAERVKILEDITTLESKVDEVITREAEQAKWHWWGDILKPLLLLVFVGCVIKAFWNSDRKCALAAV